MIQRFSKSASAYWSNEAVQRDMLESFGREHGVKALDDWYSVKATEVTKALNFIRTYYNNSVFSALKTLYPHHNWDPLKLPKVPQRHWRDLQVQRDALERVGRENKVQTLDDWYNVNTSKVIKELSFIREYYNNSLFTALKTLYPHHNWDPLKMTKVPNGFWKDTKAQRDALERIGRDQFGVKELDDWYSVDGVEVFKELNFLKHHYSSLFDTLKKLYPQHNWDPDRLKRVPHRYWKDENAQRDALERIGREHFGVKKLDDWYSLSTADVKHKLSFIRSHYVNLPNALKKLYPQHNWDPLKFVHTPRGYWRDDSRRKYYHSLFTKWKEEHNLQHLSDWYNLTPEQVSLFQRASKGIFGSTSRMLREWFPSTNWCNEVQSSAPEINLQMMLRLVTEDVVVHHRIGKHSVDIYIPEMNVAIEYQGSQHFQQSWRGNFKSQMQRDEEKQALLEKYKIPLIPISYQWNGTWSQLKSTLRKYPLSQ